MANLRDLSFGYGAGTSITPQDFSVYNTSTQTASNGGQCCAWTVPSGTTYAVFEMWSGGGSGDGSCCCMQGGGAGAGGAAFIAAIFAFMASKNSDGGTTDFIVASLLATA